MQTLLACPSERSAARSEKPAQSIERAALVGTRAESLKSAPRYADYFQTAGRNPFSVCRARNSRFVNAWLGRRGRIRVLLALQEAWDIGRSASEKLNPSTSGLWYHRTSVTVAGSRCSLRERGS